MASDSNTTLGTGGMITKIHAAEIAGNSGIPTVLANGKDPSILYDIILNEEIPGTLFEV